MDNRIKGLRVIICIILLAALCACSAVGQNIDSQPDSSELEDLNRQVSSLEAQIVVLEEQLAQTQDAEAGNGEGEYETGYVDVGGLLGRISESGKTLTAFPALVTGVDVSETGCTLTFDKLEINPNFTADGESEEPYLLNAEAVTEQAEGRYSYAQYDGRVTSEIGQDFAEYIADSEGGVQFTFYMLGNELVLVSEITVP